MAPGSNQSITEMSTRNISWGGRRLVHRADLTTSHVPTVLRYADLLETSWTKGPVKGLLYLFL